MAKMSPEEVVAFMRTGSRTGKLAVIRPDGSPSVTPVWFDFDDATGELVFMTQIESFKGRCLQRDPRVSICVDLMEMPYDFARIDGTATLTPYADDPEGALHWATETCRRFVGDDRADEFGRRNADPSEMVVRVTPTRHVGQQRVTD
ncbi:MAG: PPOX class F420-dependent oxidoreductase [Actinomycetota bacterium]